MKVKHLKLNKLLFIYCTKATRTTKTK